MTDEEQSDFNRELADLRKRVAERECRGPVSSWSASDIAASREDAACIKRLMQRLIDESPENARSST